MPAGAEHRGIQFQQEQRAGLPLRPLYLAGNNKQALGRDLILFCSFHKDRSRVNASEGQHQRRSISLWNSSRNNSCPSHEDVTKGSLWGVSRWVRELIPSLPQLLRKILTWFFPFSISRLVTFPKGSPSPITSASFTSLGSLRTWTTREGTPELRTSPLNFFVSLPLATGEGRGGGGGANKQEQIQSGRQQKALACLE